jgi:hypothetical protein
VYLGMIVSNIKNIIEDVLLNRIGKLNARKMMYLEVDYPKIVDGILEATSFLPKKTSIDERIFCILNGINERLNCRFCGKKRSYVKYRGYRETCGKGVCGAKFRYENYKNRERTGKSTKKVKDKYRKYYETFALNITQFSSNDDIAPPYLQFSSRKHIDNCLTILKKTSEII